MDVKSINQQSLSQYLQLDMLKRNWQEAMLEPRFKMELAFTFAASVAIIYFMPGFFQLIQSRSGVLPKDPLLDLIRPMDVSGYLFMLLYTSAILAIGYMLYFPKQFVMGVQAYCLLTIMRFVAVYLVPLDPSPELVPLVDPILNDLFYKSPSITKDLFFSGHTATLFMIALVVNHRGLKIFFTIVTMLIGTLVLIQHIHYSFDVFAAPFFAWLSVFIAQQTSKGIDKLQEAKQAA